MGFASRFLFKVFFALGQLEPKTNIFLAHLGDKLTKVVDPDSLAQSSAAFGWASRMNAQASSLHDLRKC